MYLEKGVLCLSFLPYKKGTLIVPKPQGIAGLKYGNTEFQASAWHGVSSGGRVNVRFPGYLKARPWGL